MKRIFTGIKVLVFFFFTITKTFSQLAAVPSTITANVPEADQYKVVYELNIPNDMSTLTYAQNLSSTTGVTFNRVAYYMQLDSKWVWVSMNKFNSDLTLAQLGVPVGSNLYYFQKIVSGMNVLGSSNSGVTNQTNINGNIEIWPSCYGTGAALTGIGGNGSIYDFDDAPIGVSACYGSFQVHNYGANQTIFAYNNFNSSGTNDDIGIGNNSGTASNGQQNPDWTFMSNAASYTTKKLYIMVDGMKITTQPSSSSISICQNTSSATLSVSATSTNGTINSYQWYSNTVASNTNGTLVSGATAATLTIPTSSIGSAYYYCKIGDSNASSITSAVSGQVTVNSYLWTGTVSNSFSNASNWNACGVPTSGSNVTISSTAANNLALDANRTFGILDFNGSNKKVELGNFNLTVSSIVGSNATNYVKTNGNGKLAKTITNTGNYSFPIGNSSYNPVTITNKSGASEVFSARVVDAVYLNGISGTTVTTPVVNRTWDISKTNTTTGVDFVFNWNNGEFANGTVITPKMNHHTGSVWEVPTVTSTALVGNTLTVVGYNGTFSPFAISQGTSPLPVELTAFNANCINNTTTINWQTASEHNSATFEVEKSRDGVNWTVLETVAAAGNSTAMLDYSVTDLELLAATVYYRLNQVDQDGASKIYGPISAQCGEEVDFSAVVFPNPTSGAVTIEINNSLEQSVGIQICGADGKEMLGVKRTIAAGITQIPLAIEAYKSGVYTVKVLGENSVKTVMLIVQ